MARTDVLGSPRARQGAVAECIYQYLQADFDVRINQKTTQMQ